MQTMAFEHNDQVTMASQTAAAAGAETYQSLRRVFVGAVLAMFLSVGVGIYMGTVVMGERFFQPLVVLGLTIPGLMWALIAVMLFGINEWSPYFAVTVTIFPMLVINIWAGVKSLDK